MNSDNSNNELTLVRLGFLKAVFSGGRGGGGGQFDSLLYLKKN